MAMAETGPPKARPKLVRVPRLRPAKAAPTRAQALPTSSVGATIALRGVSRRCCIGGCCSAPTTAATTIRRARGIVAAMCSVAAMCPESRLSWSLDRFRNGSSQGSAGLIIVRIVARSRSFACIPAETLACCFITFLSPSVLQAASSSSHLDKPNLARRDDWTARGDRSSLA